MKSQPEHHDAYSRGLQEDPPRVNGEGDNGNKRSLVRRERKNSITDTYSILRQWSRTGQKTCTRGIEAETKRISAITNIFTAVELGWTRDMLARNSSGDEKDTRAHLYTTPTNRNAPYFCLSPFGVCLGTFLVCEPRWRRFAASSAACLEDREKLSVWVCRRDRF